jgi:hypothetical protein
VSRLTHSVVRPQEQVLNAKPKPCACLFALWLQGAKIRSAMPIARRRPFPAQATAPLNALADLVAERVAPGMLNREPAILH